MRSISRTLFAGILIAGLAVARVAHPATPGVVCEDRNGNGSCELEQGDVDLTSAFDVGPWPILTSNDVVVEGIVKTKTRDVSRNLTTTGTFHLVGKLITPKSDLTISAATFLTASDTKTLIKAEDVVLEVTVSFMLALLDSRVVATNLALRKPGGAVAVLTTKVKVKEMFDVETWTLVVEDRSAIKASGIRWLLDGLFGDLFFIDSTLKTKKESAANVVVAGGVEISGRSRFVGHPANPVGIETSELSLIPPALTRNTVVLLP